MVANFYLVVFIVTLGITISFLVKNKTADSVFAIFGILATFNCLGRYLVAVSPTENMAAIGVKIMYIGASYAPYSIIFALARLSNVKVNKVVKIGMFIYSSIIMAMVATIGISNIYYKNMEVIKANGYNYIVKDYGPGHMLFPIMNALYFIIIFYYMIYAIKHKKDISSRTVVSISLMVCFIMLTYIIEKAFNTKISYLAIGYLIAALTMTRFFEYINKYDISNNIVYSVEKMREFGYIMLDSKYRYVGANNFIKDIFPEINDWNVEKKVPVSDSFLYTEVIKNALEYRGGEDTYKLIEVRDMYFETCCRELSPYNNKNVGYMIEFIDRTSETKYINSMKDYNNMLEEEVAEKIEDVLHMKDMLLLGVADLIENRDNSTGGHVKRTSEVVRIFSEKLIEQKDKFGVTELFLQRVAKAAPLHDIGKIAIDDKVLRKKGKYTTSEFDEMKKHTVEGARIIKQIMKNVEDEKIYVIMKNVACYHHEKWNGKGYPKGLSGTDIPIEARIMALADVFDALVSKRCYKEAFSYDEAFAIIEESLGEHFDPELGKIFLECRPVLEKLYDEYNDSEDENV